MRFLLSQFPSLEPYGWTQRSLTPGLSPARVIQHDGALLRLITVDGERVLANSADLNPQPTVGDWLAITPERIQEVLPRTSLLRRQSSGQTGAQSLAANIDIVLIVCGADRPIKPGRIDRSVALARDANAVPVLVLSKSAGVLGEARKWKTTGLQQHSELRVIVTSALENIGIDEVRHAISHRTAVLLGESGAGKSTLSNALLGSQDILTGGVRSGDNKGRHTTTARHLHLLPAEYGGGMVIDTPGIRSVGLFTDSETVTSSFAEISERESDCRFSDCTHTAEPECAVLTGLLDGSISPTQYAAWSRLQRDVKSLILRSDTHDLRSQARQTSKDARRAQERRRR